MDRVVKIIGGIRAFIGTAAIAFGMYAVPSPEGVPAFGLMYNVGLFVIPTLIAYAIGAGIFRKRPAGRE